MDMSPSYLKAVQLYAPADAVVIHDHYHVVANMNEVVDEVRRDEQNRLRVRWVPGKEVIGVPYDTPILGYRNNTANTLRLWTSEAPESFDFSTFNRGDHHGAVIRKVACENISKVLYPNDEQLQGTQGDR